MPDIYLTLAARIAAHRASAPVTLGPRSKSSVRRYLESNTPSPQSAKARERRLEQDENASRVVKNVQKQYMSDVRGPVPTKFTTKR